MNQFWKTGDALIANIHRYQRYKARAGWWPRLLGKLAALRHFVLSVVTASDISPYARLGAGLKLPHPNGIVIHDDAVIGAGLHDHAAGHDRPLAGESTRR